MPGITEHTKPQLEIYFRNYIVNVLGRKPSTANHYIQGLRTVSRYLRDARLIQEHLFEVDELPQLLKLRDALRLMSDFVEQDEVGNRMYTAGLNRYIEFAELGFETCGRPMEPAEAKPVDLALLDAPVSSPPKSITTISARWSRDRIIVRQVLQSCSYRCEIDGSHETFITRTTHLPYLEGHHLVPLAVQGDFTNSLDVYANLIGLCPLCHRKMHFADNKLRRSLLASIYTNRATRFANSGIAMSKDEFLAAACR